MRARRRTADSPDPITIAAAVIRDGRGRHLLVRKCGTDVFMQAGGKLEPGESPAAALARELREELGVELDADAPPQYLGLFRAAAANEPGRQVHAYLFEVTLSGDVAPAAEIAEILWLDPACADHARLAPLTRRHVLGGRG